MNIIDIKILDERLHGNLQSVTYQTPGSSGIDLRAMISHKLHISSNEVMLIPTGIAIFIKDPLITAMILPRSGLGHNHGIILGNSVGLIDSDYQGQLMISIWNRGVSKFLIQPSDRIAQLVFLPIIKPVFNIVNMFEKTERNIKGFGHSGI